MMRAGAPAHVVTLGAEMAVLASHDEQYRAVINQADLVVADTVGVVWAARALGRPVPGRVAGIELAERSLDGYKPEALSVFLLGGADGVAAAAAQNLAHKHPTAQIAGTQHGYFSADEEPDIARAIRESHARLVFVGIGFPRQEQWIRRNLDRVGNAVCIGVGGAFDVWSGRLKRAPAKVRRAGLEWLYRLVNEPHRFRRQLALPQFAAEVTAQAIRRRLAARRSSAAATKANEA